MGQAKDDAEREALGKAANALQRELSGLQSDDAMVEAIPEGG